MLLILWRTIEDHDTLFVLAEAAHFVGIGLLGWKIWTKKSVAGAQQQRTLEEARHVGRRSAARAARCVCAHADALQQRNGSWAAMRTTAAHPRPALPGNC